MTRAEIIEQAQATIADALVGALPGRLDYRDARPAAMMVWGALCDGWTDGAMPIEVECEICRARLPATMADSATHLAPEDPRLPRLSRRVIRECSGPLRLVLRVDLGRVGARAG